MLFLNIPQLCLIFLVPRNANTVRRVFRPAPLFSDELDIDCSVRAVALTLQDIEAPEFLLNELLSFLSRGH